jgi:hypothetical protein
MGLVENSLEILAIVDHPKILHFTYLQPIIPHSGRTCEMVSLTDQGIGSIVWQRCNGTTPFAT